MPPLTGGRGPRGDGQRGADRRGDGPLAGVPTARLGLGLALAAVAVGGLLASPAALAGVRDLVHSPWFPVALLALYAVRPLLAWPITLCTALVGYRYGLVLGLPIALAGAVGTSLLPYAVGRRYGRLPPNGVLGRLSAGSSAFFRAVGDVRGLVGARLVPTPPEAVSAAAGAGGVSLWAFAVGTAVGELPWTVAALLLGASLDRLALDALHLDPSVVAAVSLVGLLLLAGPLYRWVSGRVTRS
ncbi:MAG: TVP38/TMEM64 family protein [Halobacteriaceae archaeon]